MRNFLSGILILVAVALSGCDESHDEGVPDVLIICDGPYAVIEGEVTRPCLAIIVSD